MRQTLDYEDFVLRIDSDYKVRILRAPYGAPEARFRPPPWLSNVDRLLSELERTVLASGRIEGTRDLVPQTSPCVPCPGNGFISPEQVGRDLFDALFDGPILRSLLQSLGQIENEPHKALRLRLALDPAQPRIAPLCALPWELLYRSDSGDFLSRQLLTTTVRQLEVPRITSTPAPVEDRPLRILLVISSPKGLAPLDLENEVDRIQKSWGSRLDVRIEILERPTLKEVYKRIRHRPCHILHFMGHGTFDRHTGEGALLFETKTKAPHAIGGRVLAETLRQNRQLRLVFLNACQSAEFSRRGGQDPFTGVAAALVSGGMPAVLAMQFPITDRAAIVFSEAFYASLAAGDLIESAATDARLAVFQSQPDSYEWATPVLFMQASTIAPVGVSEKPDGAPTSAKQGGSQHGRFVTWNVSGNTLNASDNARIENHFHEHHSPQKEAEHHRDLGDEALSEKRYSQAAHHLSLALEKEAGTADVYYKLALAAVGGKRIRTLSQSIVRDVEQHLENAIQISPQPHYLIFLASLRHDYYTLNGLRSRPPSPQELLDAALTANVNYASALELQEHLALSSNNPAHEKLEMLAKSRHERDP